MQLWLTLKYSPAYACSNYRNNKKFMRRPRPWAETKPGIPRYESIPTSQPEHKARRIYKYV
jgi:hypothetical protein